MLRKSISASERDNCKKENRQAHVFITVLIQPEFPLHVYYTFLAVLNKTTVQIDPLTLTDPPSPQASVIYATFMSLTVQVPCGYFMQLVQTGL